MNRFNVAGVKPKILVLLIILAACGGPKEGGDIIIEASKFYATEGRSFLPDPEDKVLGFSREIDPQYPRPGVTYATLDRYHGLQVTYYDPSGKSYLWYPGNRVSVEANYRYSGVPSEKTPSGINIRVIEF